MSLHLLPLLGALRCGGGVCRDPSADASGRNAAWSKCPLGRAPARPLCLLGAHLVALGGPALPNHWAPSQGLGCSSEPPPKPPIPLPLAMQEAASGSAPQMRGGGFAAQALRTHHAAGPAAPPTTALPATAPLAHGLPHYTTLASYC